MTTNPVCIRLEPARLVEGLQTEAMAAIQTVQGELDLDVSAILQIDTAAARALEELSGVAGPRKITIRLRHVNVNVYKALMLLGLARQFRFVN